MEKEDIIKIAGVAAVGIGALVLLRGKKDEKLTLGEVKILGWTVPVTKTWIQPGTTLSVAVKWQNIGKSAISPQFGLAIKKSGLGETWKEMRWVTASKVEPGKEGIVNLGIQVPADWTNINISIRLDMNGIEGGVLEQKDAYETRALAVSGLAVRYAKG